MILHDVGNNDVDRTERPSTQADSEASLWADFATSCEENTAPPKQSAARVEKTVCKQEHTNTADVKPTPPNVTAEIDSGEDEYEDEAEIEATQLQEIEPFSESEQDNSERLQALEKKQTHWNSHDANTFQEQFKTTDLLKISRVLTRRDLILLNLLLNLPFRKSHPTTVTTVTAW